MTEVDWRQLGNLISKLQKELHLHARAKGFYDGVDPEDPYHQVVRATLIGTEVSELIEAYRRDPTAPCDKPIPLTCEQEENADIFIRQLDLSEWRGIERLIECVRIKHEYNKTRALRHGGRRC